MNIREKLRLQQVKRYPICYVNRDQSVAEHSYNVLLLALWLVEQEGDRDLKEEVIAYAINHDMDEIETGDIPSSFKRRLRQECPAVVAVLDGKKFVPNEIRAIVKLADCLEAIWYIKEFGGSSYTMNVVLPDIINNFHYNANTNGVRDSIRLRAISMEHYLAKEHLPGEDGP